MNTFGIGRVKILFFRIILMFTLAATSACSLFTKKLVITSIETESGISCKNISISNLVSGEVLAIGPPFLPILPKFIFEQKGPKLAVVDCIKDVTYPVYESKIGYYWKNDDATCEYLISIEADYGYVPLWGQAGVATSSAKCSSFKELNE